MNRSRTAERIIESWLFLTILTGCTEGPLDAMNRLIRDPVPEPPLVESFLEEQIISVFWKEDPAADSYILYRAAESLHPFFEVVAAGTECSFRDSAVEDQGRYLYRLSCLKEGVEFGPAEARLGIGSLSVRDLHEPNDFKEQASSFSYEVEANVYYYQDSLGNHLEDCDWYRLTVPPRHRAFLVVTQQLPSLAGETDTFLYSLQEGAGVRQRIIQGEAFPLINYSYDPAEIRFQITPVSAACIVDPDLGGGTVIEYLLRVVRTEAF